MIFYSEQGGKGTPRIELLNKPVEYKITDCQCNDYDVASVLLKGLSRGTIIRLRGRSNTEEATIKVKKENPSYLVPSFEEATDNEFIKMTRKGTGPLDKKISWIIIK